MFVNQFHLLLSKFHFSFGELNQNERNNVARNNFRDLHLEEVDENTVITTKWLVKRATDAIIFRENDDDVKDASWEFKLVSFNNIFFCIHISNIAHVFFYFRSYETDSHDHHQRGMIVDNELSIVGGYSVRNTGGYTTTTMYIADKNGFRPMISVRFDPNLLKSAVG